MINSIASEGAFREFVAADGLVVNESELPLNFYRVSDSNCLYFLWMIDFVFCDMFCA